MPPKIKFNRDVIVDVAFKLAKKNGYKSLTARDLAKKLNSSVIPIYSHFKSINEVIDVCETMAAELLLSYQKEKRTENTWRNIGLGYVIFAKKERALFNDMFGNSSTENKDSKYNKNGELFILKNILQEMKTCTQFKNIPEDALAKILEISWIYTHGLASLINIGAFTFSDEEIAEKLGSALKPLMAI